MIEFNFNECVFVRLTEVGRQIHRNNWLASAARKVGMPYREIVEDTEGWSQWQFWELMYEFGAYVGLGYEAPFDSQIRMQKSALKGGDDDSV